MSLSSLMGGLAKDAPSRAAKPPLPDLPPKAAIPTRTGSAVAPSGKGGGGSGTYFEEDDITKREWYPGGFVSSDGLLYFPAIKKVVGKGGEYLQFAPPVSEEAP